MGIFHSLDGQAHPSKSEMRKSSIRQWSARSMVAVLASTALIGVAAPTSATAAVAGEDVLVEADALSEEDLLRQDALNDLSRAVDGDFYIPPTTLPADNGVVIRSEPSRFYLDPVGLIEPDADVTRVMYSSTDAHGERMAVTGTVLVPNKAWRGSGPRPLIGYAVGTQGTGDHCAPSRQMAIGQEYEGPMVKALLGAGYALVLTDYQGLGTPGHHSFMVRAAQGHAVLDSVRAAQHLGLPGIDASNPVALVGYSQGGGASSSAAELAPDYAPEINLKGAYAGAVPGDLQETAAYIDSGLYMGFAMFVMQSLDSEYQLDLDSILNDEGLERRAQASDACIFDGLIDHAFVDTSSLTISGESFTDLSQREPFASALIEQKIGVGRAPEVPVLLSHSLLDDAIPYAAGRGVAKRWCSQGTRVAWDTTFAPTHAGGYAAAVPGAMLFLEARFSGISTPSSCWRI